MIKYKTFDEFQKLNDAKMNIVQQAAGMLKSPDQIGLDPTGSLAIAETEKLAHFFLTVANHCTDLLFGVSASVLDAQANVNAVEGTLYGQKTGGATDRNRLVACDPQYMVATQNFNDLKDLQKYLEMKREDFISNHHYYKHLIGDRR